MDKKTYEALPGVEWVNGKRVPENRQVELTEAEARFDLDMGRIKPKAPRRGTKPDGEKD